MIITLQVTPRLAQAIRASGKLAEPLVNMVAAHSGRLLPQFEGDNANFVNFFQVEGIAGSKIDELVYDLLHTEGVEAAYVKPAEELP